MVDLRNLLTQADRDLWQWRYFNPRGVYILGAKRPAAQQGRGHHDRSAKGSPHDQDPRTLSTPNPSPAARPADARERSVGAKVHA